MVTDVKLVGISK